MLSINPTLLLTNSSSSYYPFIRESYNIMNIPLTFLKLSGILSRSNNSYKIFYLSQPILLPLLYLPLPLFDPLHIYTLNTIIDLQNMHFFLILLNVPFQLFLLSIFPISFIALLIVIIYSIYFQAF